MAERLRATDRTSARCALWVAVALLGMVQGLAAQERARWISEELEVDMRRGEGTRFAITRMVPSGTRVELLATNAKTGYSRIRTPSGAEGWVLSRFLQSQPPARLQLPELTTRHEELQRRHAELADEVGDLRAERDALKAEVERLSANSQTLEQDLAQVRTLSASTLEIAEQNRTLLARADAAERRAEELDASNRDLTEASRRNWFLAGAGVLLVGLLLGLVLPRVRWKKKSGWNRL